jgi:hypothetical protein
MLLSLKGKIAYAKNPVIHFYPFIKFIKRSLFQVMANVLTFLTTIISFTNKQA